MIIFLNCNFLLFLMKIMVFGENIDKFLLCWFKSCNLFFWLLYIYLCIFLWLVIRGFFGEIWIFFVVCLYMWLLRNILFFMLSGFLLFFFVSVLCIDGMKNFLIVNRKLKVIINWGCWIWREICCWVGLSLVLIISIVNLDL